MWVKVEATEVWPVLSLERVERKDPPPADVVYVSGVLLRRREELQEQLRAVEEKILSEAVGNGLDREQEGIDVLLEVYGL